MWAFSGTRPSNANLVFLSQMLIPAGRSLARGAFLMRLRRIVATLAILVALAFITALVNNNISVLRPSRGEFVRNLDQTLGRSTDWVLRQYQQGAGRPTPQGRSLLSNSATAHMIVDCSSISREPRMRAIGSSFVDAWKSAADVWGKEVEPAMPARVIGDREFQALEEYQRWHLYGAAPDDVSLSPQELKDMFSADKYRTGKATHQLFALYLYRKSKGSTPELDQVMQKVEERIASEAAIDFRVTDLYLQRVAFLLAAGRTDLIRPRWVERAFAAQQTDGGWLPDWHGWSRTPYQFSFGNDSTTAHATAQGMWISCMLKYRYPEWTERNYR
jgi:hypothetical protein